MIPLALAALVLADPPYPADVTAKTLADPAALARLQRPGAPVFRDGFDTAASLESYFEVRGKDDGRARIVAGVAQRGAGALRLTAPSAGGKQAGAGVSYWFGDRGGYDQVHLRTYMMFASDYDQGNLNHTGPSLVGVSTPGKWDGMGNAGVRPKGDDRLSVGFEPWRDWGRNAAPGPWRFYVYWMDMKIDRDGNYWGNLLGPALGTTPPRGKWFCLEQMVKLNTLRDGVPHADGELAAWIDGQFYAHFTGFRWRTTERLKLKRLGLDVYVHQNRQDNTVTYDDLAVSTGYIGP